MKIIGKQLEGSSPSSIKHMAMRALSSCNLEKIAIAADIGAGGGELAELLIDKCDRLILLDDFMANLSNPKLNIIRGDLNDVWNIESGTVDFVFSLEVVEHIENPRHFFREIERILKPGGYGFVSTPNNLNFFSRLNFLFKGCHRYFQDSCYPAHISVLLPVDLKRILNENNLNFLDFYYNNQDVIPILGVPLNLPIANFSNSIGTLFQKG